MKSRMKIYNANIITPSQIIRNGSIVWENGKITDIREGDIPSDDSRSINAEGNYVAPGFIDIHTHGGGGHDFMDGTPEAYIEAAKMHARHGTTSLLPTTLCSSNDELKQTFQVFREVKKQNTNGACFLGLHLEGPYFSMKQRGAQDPKYIRDPDPAEYNEILSWTDDIIRWSAAPELDGALEFGRCMVNHGILPSIAHSDAIYEEVLDAFDNGFTHVTHLYSGMSGIRRINAFRYAGVIESAFLIDDMTVEIIADGVHLPASLLQLIYKVKGPDRIALITDSMRGAGMPDGESILGSKKDGQKVIIEDGVAKLPDRTAFAGSVATGDRLVRTMIQKANVPLIDAIKMMTATPAKIIGAQRHTGSLMVGKDADIVVFDENINIQKTIIQGKIVYEKSSDPG